MLIIIKHCRKYTKVSWLKVINKVTITYQCKNMVHININLPPLSSFLENGWQLCFIYETECSHTSHSTVALHAAPDSKVALLCSTVCKVSSTWSYTRLSYFTLRYRFDWEIYIHEVSYCYLLPTLSAVPSDINQCPRAVSVHGWDSTDNLIESLLSRG